MGVSITQEGPKPQTLTERDRHHALDARGLKVLKRLAQRLHRSQHHTGGLHFAWVHGAQVTAKR
jgi:hypothetical protein